ncbi:c-type cytochrome [Magnetospirillum moscoviense]|nr:cytochrome c [Magnetospirillum moscoviense]
MRVALTVALGLVVMAAPAWANSASADAGGELAARWCAACHVVSPSGAGGNAGPSFGSIAKDRRAADIRAALTKPHAKPMKGFKLKRHEVDDVTAYIESLEARR